MQLQHSVDQFCANYLSRRSRGAPLMPSKSHTKAVLRAFAFNFVLGVVAVCLLANLGR